MSDIVITNKNLCEALKENNRLEQVLCQCQKRTSGTGGCRATGRGGTAQHKKGTTTAGHAGMKQVNTTSNARHIQRAIPVTIHQQTQEEGYRRTSLNDSRLG